MNFKEIKERLQPDFDDCGMTKNINKADINWLIAEVERLNEVIKVADFVILDKFSQTQKDTAIKCAEIAEKYEPTERQDYIEYASTEIRKEFRLDK